MHCFFALLTPFFLLCCLLSSTFACDSFCLSSSSLDVGLGYRSDQLDWNIAGNMAGENPNIRSELSWSDLAVSQLQLAGQLEFAEVPLIKQNLAVRANIFVGKIWSGTVRDSDYAADNRTNEYSRSVSDSDKGMTADISGAVGPIFEFEKIQGLRVTPLIGYGFNMQELTMTNGEQVVTSTGTRELGHIPGLDSSYTAYWYGPWLGATVNYLVNERLTLALGLEYHWVDFFAQADWNLRSEFEHPVSFEHEARGSGIVWNFNGSYQLSEKWSWLLNATIQNWTTRGGSDRTFLAAGTVGKTRLNEVNWDSYALTTGVSYQF